MVYRLTPESNLLLCEYSPLMLCKTNKLVFKCYVCIDFAHVLFSISEDVNAVLYVLRMSGTCCVELWCPLQADNAHSYTFVMYYSTLLTNTILALWWPRHCRVDNNFDANLRPSLKYLFHEMVLIYFQIYSHHFIVALLAALLQCIR